MEFTVTLHLFLGCPVDLAHLALRDPEVAEEFPRMFTLSRRSVWQWQNSFPVFSCWWISIPADQACCL